MKFSQTIAILALSVFTWTVSANTITKIDISKDVVNDKAITMMLIAESLEHHSLTIEVQDFEKDVKALLALKPYLPTPSFFDFKNEWLPTQSSSKVAAE